VSLADARRKLPEIIDQVGKGERIGITRRGKLAAVIVPARSKVSLRRIFREIEKLRGRARPHKNMTTKDFIQEGRI
jgi:prevent-host-death family protein